MNHQERFVNETVISLSCKVNTHLNPCQVSPELKFQLLVNMSRPYVHIQGKDLPKNKIVADQVVNICTLANHGSFDMFSRIGYELVRKNINFDLKCPFKKVIDQQQKYEQLIN